MKTILLILSCILFSLNVFGQPEPTVSGMEVVAVEEIILTRDDGNGKPGEVAESFTTTDIPIHCSVQLTSTKAATVKMNFVAVKVAGVKPETKVVTVSYTTNGKQNRVNFSGSPEDTWSAGTYRIDVFIDGKEGGSQAFEIKETRTEVPGKKFTQSKPSPKPKIVKRFKKN